MWFGKRNRRQAAKRDSESRLTALLAALAPVNRKRAAIVIAGVVIAVGMLGVMIQVLDRPVQRIEVMGKFHRVSPLQVEHAVLSYAKPGSYAAHGFVSIRLDEIKQVVESIDWVDRARIERRWPNGVRVEITEQIPGARWGESGLLNSRGELFLKETRYVPAELPQLNGPEGTESQVARLYLDTYPRLAGVGLRLARVTLDARGSWELVVTNRQGATNSSDSVTVRLGRQDVNERLERFIAAASPLIATRGEEMNYVDLRYSNGFAVGWNGGAKTIAKSAASMARPAIDVANKINSQSTPDA